MTRIAPLLMLALFAAPLAAEPFVLADRVYEVDHSNTACAICRKQCKEILVKLPNVKSVDYDLKCYKCYVTMNGDTKLTYAQVEEAFRTSKYVFRGITECKTPPKLSGSATGS